MLHDSHHLHDRVARIERRLDQIAYGGMVGLRLMFLGHACEKAASVLSISKSDD